MVKNYEPYKDDIIKLYKDHSVDDVVAIMKQRKFSASRRWYLSKFNDWNCQKTSNRKKIASRQSREAPVVEFDDKDAGIAEPQDSENEAATEESRPVSRAPSTPLGSIRGSRFLDACPHSSKCPSAPFLTLEEYAGHQKRHHSRILDAFRWNPAQRSLGITLTNYLTQLARGDRAAPLLIDSPQFHDLFRNGPHTYDPLDILDCAEVLLHFELDKNSSICTIKAIVAREATFSEAKPALERLASAAGQILTSDPSHYPHVIEWIFDLVMACGSEDDAPEWEFLQTRLFRIQEHANIPPSLKEYVGTFILQKFIDRLRFWPQKVPSLDLVVEMCEQFMIPLDVGYISTLQELDQEQASACATVASDEGRTPASGGVTPGNPPPAYYTSTDLVSLRPSTSDFWSRWENLDFDLFDKQLESQNYFRGVVSSNPVEDVLSPPLRPRSRQRGRARAVADPYLPSSPETHSMAPSRSITPHVITHRRQSLNSVPNRDYILRLADPAYQADTAGAEPARRIQKHPATFQCSLCPKRFTRAYNLRSHLRTHTDFRPFVCSVCGKAFARQHDRKRHEGLHSGEKMFICKGELKDNGQWGCGRKFHRVDALGRHFKSEAGRVCIEPLLKKGQSLWNQSHGDMDLDHSQQERSAHVVSNPETGPTGENGMSVLPAALLAQYPALATLNWSDLPSNDVEMSDEAAGRSGFNATGSHLYDGSEPESSNIQETRRDLEPPAALDVTWERHNSKETSPNTPENLRRRHVPQPVTIQTKSASAFHDSRFSLICGFCSSFDQHLFTEVQVLKLHLMSVHAVRQIPPRPGEETSEEYSSRTQELLFHKAADATRKCSLCPRRFIDAQHFYDHLDQCVIVWLCD